LWIHSVLLPIRCSVLSFLDVYLQHFGFKFDDDFEECTVLKKLLMDISNSKALQLWGWEPEKFRRPEQFDNPHNISPGLFKQFPVVSSALCKAIKSERKTNASLSGGVAAAARKKLSSPRRKLMKRSSFVDVGRSLMKKQSSFATFKNKRFSSRNRKRAEESMVVDFDNVVVQGKSERANMQTSKREGIKFLFALFVASLLVACLSVTS